jgi:REP element-mobilizing transposase RayT
MEDILKNKKTMKYNPDIHRRRSIRLKGYDYSQAGMYFVTICVQNRECLFGEIIDGEMILNKYGKIVQMVWEALPQHYPHVQLGEFVGMPNHIHGIIVITGSAIVGAGLKPALTKPAPTILHGLSEIVRALKTFSARKINKLRNTAGIPVWQRNYYDHIIRNNDSYLNIANYIITNPEKWTDDKFFNPNNKK